MKKEKTQNILLAQNDVAGYLSGLQQGFSELGIQSDTLFVSDHRFGIKTEGEKSDLFLSLIKLLNKMYSSPNRSALEKRIWYYIFYLVKQFYFVLISPLLLLKYEVFIFAFGHTLFNGRELWLYRMFNKKVICIFNGSDIRPAYSGTQGYTLTTMQLLKFAKKQKRLVRRLERGGAICITHSATSHFHESKIIKSLEIGVPKQITMANETNDVSRKRKVRILHAPSNERIKGSKVIRQYINQLSQKYDIEYIELVNKSNAEVLEEISMSDFVLDQVYSDTPLAGLATEAAFMGVPTIVGGYYSKDISEHNNSDSIPPSLYVHPDDLFDAIEKMIVEPEYRIELGARAQRFVKSRWSSKQVASKLLKIIDEDIPSDWWFDPDCLERLYPFRNEEEVYDVIEEIVKIKGISALLLSDKPRLEVNIMNKLKRN